MTKTLSDTCRGGIFAYLNPFMASVSCHPLPPRICRYIYNLLNLQLLIFSLTMNYKFHLKKRGGITLSIMSNNVCN